MEIFNCPQYLYPNSSNSIKTNCSLGKYLAENTIGIENYSTLLEIWHHAKFMLFAELPKGHYT
jgi:hypothetical protein